MREAALPTLNAKHWLFIFISLHLLVWTLAPILIRYNLPLDSIEGSLWGRQLEWGYDKNPYLNAWLTAFAIYVGGTSGWLVYLFSQLSVAGCFLALWQLGKKILGASYALLAVMLLEGVQYYHVHAIDFNDNTLELSLWAGSIYFFYQALRQKQNNLAWILTGLLAGFGVMAKYYTLALITTMFLFLLRHENRKQLLTAAPYLGLIAFITVIAPHAIWLCSHEFITVKYVLARTSDEPRWFNHVYYPALFLWQQFETFLPVIILAIPLFFKEKENVSEPQKTINVSRFDKLFLIYMGLGPFVLTLGLSLIFGIKLRAGWGVPLLSLWSMMLLASFQPKLSNKKIYIVIASIFIVMATLVSMYSLSLMRSDTHSTANFPGKPIAEKLTNLWHEKYHQPLHYVAGPRWLGGNISLYSDDRPQVFMEWDNLRSPWINDEALNRKGAIFVWDMSQGKGLPKEIKSRYPRLLTANSFEFELYRNHHNLPPVKIGVAFLPPL